MAKTIRTIVVGALNITMHRPHTPQRYVDLFQAAFAAERLFAQGEIHGLMLGRINGLEDAVANNEITGEVYRFVKIDADEPWFDIETRRQATPEQVGQISIPENLLAHMQKIIFVFYPREHELWFVSKDRKDTLAIGVAQKFFEALLGQIALEQGFPLVNVTAIPDADALDEIWGLPGLHRVELSFKRPNPDDGGGLEAEFEDRLARMNVRTRQEVLAAPRGELLEPDDQLRAEATVAARNGHVKGLGHDELGVPIEITTASKPQRLYMRVDSAIETVMDVLRRARHR